MMRKCWDCTEHYNKFQRTLSVILNCKGLIHFLVLVAMPLFVRLKYFISHLYVTCLTVPYAYTCYAYTCYWSANESGDRKCGVETFDSIYVNAQVLLKLTNSQTSSAILMVFCVFLVPLSLVLYRLHQMTCVMVLVQLRLTVVKPAAQPHAFPGTTIPASCWKRDGGDVENGRIVSHCKCLRLRLVSLVRIFSFALCLVA